MSIYKIMLLKYFARNTKLTQRVPHRTYCGQKSSIDKEISNTIVDIISNQHMVELREYKFLSNQTINKIEYVDKQSVIKKLIDKYGPDVFDNDCFYRYIDDIKTKHKAYWYAINKYKRINFDFLPHWFFNKENCIKLFTTTQQHQKKYKFRDMPKKYFEPLLNEPIWHILCDVANDDDYMMDELFELLMENSDYPPTTVIHHFVHKDKYLCEFVKKIISCKDTIYFQNSQLTLDQEDLIVNKLIELNPENYWDVLCRTYNLSIPAALFNKHNTEPLVKIVYTKNHYFKFHFNHEKEHNEKHIFSPISNRPGGFTFTTVNNVKYHVPTNEVIVTKEPSLYGSEYVWKKVPDESAFELYSVTLPNDADNYVSNGRLEYKAGGIKLGDKIAKNMIDLTE